MPHTILEYTANVADFPDFQVLWERLHGFLAEAAPCRIEHIKSRAHRCEDFRVGGGREDLAFVHLTIRLMEGRDGATLARIGEGVLAILREQFPVTFNQLRADFTVEICGMRPDAYFKAAAHPSP